MCLRLRGDQQTSPTSAPGGRCGHAGVVDAHLTPPCCCHCCVNVESLRIIFGCNGRFPSPFRHVFFHDLGFRELSLLSTIIVTVCKIEPKPWKWKFNVQGVGSGSWDGKASGPPPGKAGRVDLACLLSAKVKRVHTATVGLVGSSVERAPLWGVRLSKPLFWARWMG